VLVLQVSAACLWAEPKLPAILSDRMVLQQNQDIRIWGLADPDEKITVTLAKASATVTTSKDGRWAVSLSPLSAGGPYDLHVEGKTTIVLHEVMVGEVWIASGQSNMTYALRLAVDGDTAQKGANYPKIRLFKVPKTASDKGEWRLCSPDTAGTFSAVAYFFARQIHENLGVPVGIIESAYQGTTIEQWSEPEALAKITQTWSAVTSEGSNSLNDKNPPSQLPSGQLRPAQLPPSYLYSTMVKPLFPLVVRGVIWYQGESNVHRAFQYHDLLSALIDSWRKGFQNDNLQFLIVQLPGFGLPDPEPRDSAWAELREAQFRVAQEKTGVGLIVTIDLGDSKLHPPRKREVGERLAGLALSSIYRRPRAFSTPIYSSAVIDKNMVVVHFAKGTDKLAVRGDGPLVGFELAGGDHKFHWADASIQGDTVVVSSPSIRVPVAVRYAWTDNPICNLTNEAGFPAGPFRSDDWPGPTLRRAHASKPGVRRFF
ncbi:MAG: sialate O-acetylesterase, partial [Mycobacterium sp.]